MKKQVGWSGSEQSEEKVIFKKFLVKLVLGIVAAAMVIGCAIFFLAEYFLPVDKNSKEEIIVEIPLNSSSKAIGSILEGQGIIKNADVFYYYSRITGSASNFKAGTYVLSKSYSLPKLSKALGEGKLFAEAYKITIPEGYTVKQIAKLLDENDVVSEAEFLKVVEDENFKQLATLKNIDFPVDAKYALEGLLYPQTYEFYKSDTTVDIVQKMIMQTWSEVPQEWLDEIDRQGKTFYEILIMASIIEKEAVVPEERARIAGVYYNRLRDGMKLQADATIQYALGGHKDVVLYSDLKIDSPYNTYRYTGMPPTPISNAGKSAIEAAIFPEKHNYYYYVTKKDGTSGHYFSETYEEHLKNIEISKSALKPTEEAAPVVEAPQAQ